MFKTLLVHQMSIISPMDNVYSNVTNIPTNQPNVTLDERLLVPCELELECLNVDVTQLDNVMKENCIGKLFPYTQSHIDNIFSTTDLSKKVRESVVIISTEESSGSGFVVNHINNQTLVITNSHVVDGAKNTLIKWSDGSEDIASVRFDLGGRTNLTDLALLIVDGKKGKILPSRVTQVSTKKQRELSLSIKRARYLALLPFVSN